MAGVHAAHTWTDWQRDAEFVYAGEYQVAQFLAEHPQPHGVIVGDVGAVGYYSDSPIVDASALITLPLVKSMTHSAANSDALLSEARARGVSIEVGEDDTSLVGWRPVVGLQLESDVRRPPRTTWFFAANETAAALLDDVRAFANRSGGRVRLVAHR